MAMSGTIQSYKMTQQDIGQIGVLLVVLPLKWLLVPQALRLLLHFVWEQQELDV